MKFAVIIACLLLICAYTANASGSKRALISIRLENPEDSVQKIRIISYQKYFTEFDKYDDTSISADENGFFNAALPAGSLAKIKFLTFFFANKDHCFLNDLIIEPGDNIILSVKTKNKEIVRISVSGPGAFKYECRAAVLIVFKNLRRSRLELSHELSKSGDPFAYGNPDNLDKIIQLYQKVRLSSMKILNNYRARLGPGIFQVMRADIIGETGDLWELDIANHYSVPYGFPKEKTKRFYLSNHLIWQNLDKSVIALSPLYVDYTYDRTLNSIAFEKNIRIEDISFQNIYAIFKKRFRGEMKERLIMLSITDPLKNFPLASLGNSANKYIRVAMQNIKTPDFKERIKKSVLVAARSGVTAYNFKLSDTLGNQVSLGDFKGNIVLMDIWYTGCTGCAILAQKIKLIKPQIYNTNSFKMISICIDEDKNRWMNSLSKGIYTDKENINLHLPVRSNVNDFNNIPMLKYYALTGLPFAILIDKAGLIIGQLSSSDKPDKILLQINEAIRAE